MDKVEIREYSGKVPNALRVDTILSWLDLPTEKRPTILALYFSDVNDAGHEFSPDAFDSENFGLDSSEK